MTLQPDDVDGLAQIQSICNAEEDDVSGVGVVSRLCGVRAKVYGMLDNTSLALQLYKTSIMLDVRNLNSWDEVIMGNFMGAGEGEAFLSGLEFGGREWLKDLYYSRLRRHLPNSTAAASVEGAFKRLKGKHGFGGCSNVLVREAQATWDRHEVDRTAEIVEKR